MERKVFLGVIPAAAAVGFSAESAQAPTTDEERFVGTYRLISSPGGGENPIGRIYYDRAGRMGALLHPAQRKPLPESPTADDYRELVRGVQAYFGTYTVDESAGTVTHHIEGGLQPQEIGGERVRWYEFVGDRLHLKTSQNAAAPLVWERLPEG
jgi:hypothetical protein